MAKANAEAVQGWIPCDERMPEVNVPVWAWDGRNIRLMAYCDWYESGDMQAWCNTYRDVDYCNGKWEAITAEHDDEYGVTHWQPLPQPPEATT